MEEQVLSIEQVQELQELGFDVEKHSSMCWIKEPNGNDYILSVLDEFCFESASLRPVPTMTIGDIIKILPKAINDDGELYVLSIEIRNNNYYQVAYKSKNNDYLFCNYAYNGITLISALFDTLKWIIENKYL